MGTRHDQARREQRALALEQASRQRILILDGAMGTMIQERHLDEASYRGTRFAGLDDDPETRAMVAATTASELCRRLLAEGVSAFHFYTQNQAPLCTAVCRMLGAQPALEEAA